MGGNRELSIRTWLGLQVRAATVAWRVRQRGAPIRWRVRAALGAIVVTAAAPRFWELGYYPDFTHHDHNRYGGNILRFLNGMWHPFCAPVYSVGRPWLLLPADRHVAGRVSIDTDSCTCGGAGRPGAENREANRTERGYRCAT